MPRAPQKNEQTPKPKAAEAKEQAAQSQAKAAVQVPPSDDAATEQAAVSNAQENPQQNPDPKPQDNKEIEWLHIKSVRRLGYRRCGMRFSYEGALYPVQSFSVEQIKILQAEPNIKVSMQAKK